MRDLIVGKGPDREVRPGVGPIVPMPKRSWASWQGVKCDEAGYADPLCGAGRGTEIAANGQIASRLVELGTVHEENVTKGSHGARGRRGALPYAPRSARQDYQPA